MTWPESRMTHEIQPIKDSSNFSMCFSWGMFHESAVSSQSWASREIHIFTDSSPNSDAQLLHWIPQKYREMIEQNYNQIWHRIKASIKHSCKSQFYNLFIWLFCDKTPKQTLDLKREYGNEDKTHSHLNLKLVKHLNQIHVSWNTCT